jgi:Mrp family chromosome partitioning ATPase
MRTVETRDPKSRRARAVTSEVGHLWANLLQRGALRTSRTIGFCAIGEHERLAATFLGGRGMRIALVEASLRDPILAKVFGVPAAPGLDALLSGSGGLVGSLRRNVAPGVDLVPGTAANEPFWGFTNERFRSCLQELLKDHDLCLVSVPVLVHAPEAALVIRALDGVVLATAANRHRTEIVRRHLAFLRALGTPLLGAVLTDVVHDLPAPLARWVG